MANKKPSAKQKIKSALSAKSTFVPEKKEEYEAFIGLLESGVPIDSWANVAEALGVNKDTITDWKRTPRALVITRAQIKEALVKMKTSGALDWKMWDRYLKLLGVDAKDQVDMTSDGEALKGPIIYYPKKEQ